MTNIINSDSTLTNDNLVRKYKLTDAELAIFASNLTNSLSRNLADFSKFGVTQTQIESFSQLVSDFMDLPIDDYYLGRCKFTSESKSAIEELLRDTMRSMAIRIELRWGESSYQYDQTGLKGMSSYSGEKLLQTAMSLHTLMTELLPEQGLTALELTEFDNSINAYREAYSNQEKARAERAANTESRILLGNQLYHAVSNYCKIGRKVYRNKSLARYNQFVIYSSAPRAISAPADFSYSAADSTFYWSAVPNSSSYILEASPDGQEFSEIYSGSDLNFSYIPTTDGWSYYRIRTRNSGGLSKYSPALRVGYYQSSIPAPDNIRMQIIDYGTNLAQITWQEVPAASLYKIYHCTVPIGSAADNYSLAGKSNTPEFNIMLTPGKRTYVQLTAESDRLWSPLSGSAFIDAADHISQ